MAMVATDIKGMLSISIKSRHDSHTDQYNRIFMVKLCLVCSLIMGISWFQDSINCIVPDSHNLGGGFVSSACWIQGVYVYKELREEVSQVAYFGIPKDMDNDGIYAGIKGADPSAIHLCSTTKKLDGLAPPTGYCKPMQKTFFLQYQWMPFFIASLAILFYVPYVAFRTVNNDLISLKNSIKADDADSEKIAKHYFNSQTNPPRTNMLRIVFNILVKILYLVANLVALLGLDNLLNGEFVGYGNKWIKWSQLNNTMAYDYMGKRDFPKPGNLLLPPFGYCEVYQSAKDVLVTLGNKHKFVCELSQNVLYQYCLIVIWFAIVFGIIISIIGLILLIVHYAIGIFGIKRRDPRGKQLFKSLTFRQLEYLEFIRKKNVIIYGEVLEKLRDNLPNAPMDDEYPPRGRGRDTDNIPLYPSLKKDRFDDKGPGYQL